MSDDIWTIVPPSQVDMEKLAQIAKGLKDLADYKRWHRMDFFSPYPKQQRFFELGAEYKERLFMAGNQLGKSEAGAMETAVHATGKYPKDWTGYRFNKGGLRIWVDSETGVLGRDVAQKKLCGPPGVPSELGTGYIPKEDILDCSLARGVTDAYDTVQVQHYDASGKKDGITTITFKSYEQGRAKHQGEPVDFIWCDEEPPADVYGEIVTRTNATKGRVIVTFTPLKGMSEVVRSFISPDPPQPGEPPRDAHQKVWVNMTIYDVGHYTEAERAAIIASYPKYMRDARAKGIPTLGSGRIFEFAEEALMETPIPSHLVPLYWRKVWGTDFGIEHPFAAVLFLHDADSDVIHAHATYRASGQLPITHAAAMKLVGARVPVAWPHDGNKRQAEGIDSETTTKLAQIYRKHGLQMLGKHATLSTGGYSTEGGIMEMQEYMATGRFKVASHLTDWFEEFRLYHRKDGVIVKEHDDLMSASRIGVIQRRSAQPVPLGGQPLKQGRGRVLIADGVDPGSHWGT